MNNSKTKLLAAPYIFWIAAFILIPLVFVVYYAFTDMNGSFTFANVSAIANPEYLKALSLAVLLALISTVICLLLSYPLALILKSFEFKRNNFIIFIFILPMWMNFLLRTYAWKTILSVNGVLDQIIAFLHLPAFNIINTPYAIVFGMVYDYLPFMILPVYNVLIKIDNDTINAARDLGANYFQTLRKVILPLSLPGVISGIIMVFVPSLTTFVISEILGGRKYLLIGDVIERQFMQTSNWNLGSGLSLILMLFVILYVVVSSRSEKAESGGLL